MYNGNWHDLLPKRSQKRRKLINLLSYLLLTQLKSCGFKYF